MLKNISFAVSILLLLQGSLSQANTPAIKQKPEIGVQVIPKSAAQEQFIIPYGISKISRILGLLFFGAIGIFCWVAFVLGLMDDHVNSMEALYMCFPATLFSFMALQVFFNNSYIICSSTGIRLPERCACNNTLIAFFSLSSKHLPEIPYSEIEAVIKTTEVEYSSNGNYTYPIYYQVLNIFRKDMQKYQIRVDNIINSHDLYRLQKILVEKGIKVAL